jgi:hypothetical protein
VKIVGCPSQYCRSVNDAVRLFELFGKGILPVSGGALDQSAWFLAAERQFRIDEIAMRSESQQ